jgi:acetolactate synthase-1/3 small subunit
MKKQDCTVIELTLNNHPGVLSHITNLFSRRDFKLEGILYGSIGEGTINKMYLLVKKNRQLFQIMQQLEKLHDVLLLTQITGFNQSVFFRPDASSPDQT